MQNKPSKKQQRTDLRKKLKWGDIETICEITEYHRNTVQRWFNGENDIESIDAAVNGIIEKREKKIQEKINQAV
ncbi:MAG: hypothetical protein CL528_11505 [Aequorivita sp.]|nr:hypothetical protein [Aequorivita sp.]MBP42393.1 hypothetical protein [Aequorivita sp.]|tara:strand:- start:5134 stop:5355 length:222 start_codon:yes stop_codon:yes gene_type:complete